jgi:hypothetical protein
MLLSSSIFCIFNNITINRNNTAIAPTYTIINNKPKKSTLSNIKIIEVLKNVLIKNKTEFIGFIEITIQIAENIMKK